MCFGLGNNKNCFATLSEETKEWKGSFKDNVVKEARFCSVGKTNLSNSTLLRLLNGHGS